MTLTLKRLCWYTLLIMRNRHISLASLIALSAALPAASSIPSSGRHGGKVFHAFKTRLKPAAPMDAFHMGMQDIDNRQYDSAVAQLSKAVAQRPSAARYFMLGYAHYSRGFASGTPETANKMDAVKVVENYKAALALDPKFKEIKQPYKLYHGLGMAYEALGINDKALTSYRQAFMLAPTDLALPIYGARLRMKMGATRKSLANFEMALKLASQSGQQASIQAFLKSNPMFKDMLKDQAHSDLVAKYEAPISPANGPSAAPQPAGSLANMVAMEPMIPPGDPFGLRDSVRSPTRPKPAAEPSAAEQEVLQAIAAGNDEFKFRHWAKAIDRYDWALSLSRHSQTLGPGEIAFVNERIGTAYNKVGRTSEAVTSLRLSVMAMPYNCAAHYQLALAYSLSGHYAEATKSLREALKTAPSPSELRKTVLLAKTDSELEPLRDLPAYKAAMQEFAPAPASSQARR